jgi:hypothetical protein
MPLTHKQQFNKRHGFNKDEPHSKAELSKISKIPVKVLDIIFDRGVGTYSTNPSSVRKYIKSPEEWAYSRIYAFINKIENNKPLDHDIDLILKL